MRLKIDGEHVVVIRVLRYPDPHTPLRVYVSHPGTVRVHAVHDLPTDSGNFRTNGHSYEVKP